ncbi:enoyl-CoA hydratase-related protein [Pseudomonas lopnurensis]|uniref:enoyl-CoA hydratase-related protein n=1 Tax=Pseudomonas lopnurensis TaxID=1477517 RepID=UPI0028AF92DE|nr:enoyl-CoA hydratase-related protein [Pseudomonas lopnurensis]
MTDISGQTPILIGVGQASERLDDPDYHKLSPVDLAAEAAKAACADALSLEALAPRIDAIYAVRTVADSVPAPMRPQRAPFGSPNNTPAAVAARIGAKPNLAVYSPACGDEPQKLLGEACERLYAGELKMVLLCGAEAASTQRAAQAAGEKLDWAEQYDMPLDDRHWNVGGMRTKVMNDHNMLLPTSVYPLLENARRARLGLSREAYALEMGRLMAPFSQVAANNPHAASPQARSAEQIATVDADNRMIADPHPRSVVARDQVNQGAALLLTTVATARELGIAENQWVFLHGYSAADERHVLEREDLGASTAMAGVYQQALEEAGVSLEQIGYLDIYSCFPIAVFSALDALGLSADDPRGLTLTGGLPYFGGPGNNYSMHAIAELAQRLRADPGSYGLVGANGGFMNTHAAGVYSTTPHEWRSCDSSALQARIDALPAPAFSMRPSGWGRVETYTVLHGKNGPSEIILVGRLERTGERFVANSIASDEQTLRAFVEQDGLSQRVCLRWHQGVNRFAIDQGCLDRLIPPPSNKLQARYEHVLVERRGHVLEVVINRPEVKNALLPEANDELEQIFNAYEADDSLWVAIISGAGQDAFCTGNDLKAASTGRRMWMPRTGFGGLTARPDRVKPVICAVNGYAMGGGFEIALASDLVVADEAAQFALSEVRVGLLAGAGGLQRLTRQIPYKQAMEIILTGRRIPAEEGRQLGFVNRVVPAGMALEGARALAEELLECSPNSIRLSKQLLNDSARHASEGDSVLPAYRAIDRVVNSEDRIEGVMAFAQKRKPMWKNR